MQVMLIPAVSAPSRIRRLPSVRVGLFCGPLCISSLVCFHLTFIIAYSVQPRRRLDDPARMYVGTRYNAAR
jgi:hypothetical protein